MNTLYVLEGADGTGKSTLANAIAAETKGHVLHGSWYKDWYIKSYHKDLYRAAVNLLQYQDVVLDRWAVSEEVYSNAYRGGAEYSADEFMESQIGSNFLQTYPDATRFIYCTNDRAAENHDKNKTEREEMFDDINPVIDEYKKYMARTALKWVTYDFSKVDMDTFVKVQTIKGDDDGKEYRYLGI